MLYLDAIISTTSFQYLSEHFLLFVGGIDLRPNANFTFEIIQDDISELFGKFNLGIVVNLLLKLSLYLFNTPSNNSSF